MLRDELAGGHHCRVVERECIAQFHVDLGEQIVLTIDLRQFAVDERALLVALLYSEFLR